MQEQGHLQMMCREENELIFSDEVFMQWSTAGHLQTMCTGAESPSSLPPMMTLLRVMMTLSFTPSSFDI